ncbi:Conserved_hypothetical protein [Hexamita inflata]|uniref:Leucine rich repeat protein n=1 Tax=Hexamita inflata TaxID=28002 RepID=A0AA86TFE8_9EUKA|nr:Conserved hypothetical protein [Hexamita inflata]
MSQSTILHSQNNKPELKLNQIISNNENIISEQTNGTLTFYDNQKLNSLEFLKDLNVKRLELQYCKNIIPKLKNEHIQELQICFCNFQNLKDFQLNILEILEFQNYNEDQDATLVQQMLQYTKLKELKLECWKTDLSPLSQLVNICKLSLNSCGISNIDLFKPLTNLTELSLDNNKDINITTISNHKKLTKLWLCSCCLVKIDAIGQLVNLEYLYLDSNENIEITPIQFLTQLKVLWLSDCKSLINIEALRPISKLQELCIEWNSIVYVQPLIDLKQLVKVNVFYNYIVDIKKIEKHHNFDQFKVREQQKPTNLQHRIAKYLKSFYSVITKLRNMRKQQSKQKYFKLIINKCLQNQSDVQAQFIEQAASLIQMLNTFECCQ